MGCLGPSWDLGESWPPLGSPLLPSPHSSPAHPCSPRAPAWNPGLAPASAPTLGSAQPSRGATCVVAEAAGEPLADSFPPPLALGLSHPLLASSIHLSQETPAPSPALCPAPVIVTTTTLTAGLTAPPACQTQPRLKKLSAAKPTTPGGRGIQTQRKQISTPTLTASRWVLAPGSTAPEMPTLLSTQSLSTCDAPGTWPWRHSTFLLALDRWPLSPHPPGHLESGQAPPP